MNAFGMLTHFIDHCPHSSRESATSAGIIEELAGSSDVNQAPSEGIPKDVELAAPGDADQGLWILVYWY